MHWHIQDPVGQLPWNVFAKMLKGTVMQIEKALIKYRLRASKVS